MRLQRVNLQPGHCRQKAVFVLFTRAHAKPSGDERTTAGTTVEQPAKQRNDFCE
jgi:hypothetical protein